MKIEVKNIDHVWHAFFPDCVIKSAGVADITDQVEEAWPPLEKGYELQWEARGNKFIVREIESKNKKMSKSER